MRTTLIGTGLATAAAAVAGGVASRKGVRGWYTTIRKPGYVPPNALFPIAWTTLLRRHRRLLGGGDRDVPGRR